MSYSYQQINSGQVLTEAFLNQTTVNIRDHQHGVSVVASTYAGIWSSIVSNVANAVAHRLDTQTTLVTSGSKLLSIQNKDEVVFGFDRLGRMLTTKVAAVASGGMFVNSGTWDKLNFTVTSIDFLLEFNTGTGRFTATNTGYYWLQAGMNITSQNSSYTSFLRFYKNGSSEAVDAISHAFIAVMASGQLLSVNRNLFTLLAKNDYIEVYTSHSFPGSIQTRYHTMNITRVF